jgi:uncharacterized protein (TIGR03083 family)
VTRTLADTRRWAAGGAARFGDGLAKLAADDLDAPSALPGWSRRHLVAHVAANADALANLVAWAATGVPTPMYASPEQRDADIEAGSRRPHDELVGWFERSQAQLAVAMDGLSEDRWEAEVVTAQGRTVPASEIPWLRAREVMVHAVDLDTGTSFADLPEAFLNALLADIAAKRSSTGTGPALEVEATDTRSRADVVGEGRPVPVVGSLADLTAYLAGRSHAVRTGDGSPAPALPPWL